MYVSIEGKHIEDERWDIVAHALQILVNKCKRKKGFRTKKFVEQSVKAFADAGVTPIPANGKVPGNLKSLAKFIRDDGRIYLEVKEDTLDFVLA